MDNYPWISFYQSFKRNLRDSRPCSRYLLAENALVFYWHRPLGEGEVVPGLTS